MGRRAIITPEDHTERTTITGKTYIDTGGYGDGSLNTVTKGYNGKICVNGVLWDGITYTTDQGNCNLPPFLDYPMKYKKLLTPLYTYTIADGFSSSAGCNVYYAASEATVAKWLPFQTTCPTTSDNTILIHLELTSSYQYYPVYSRFNGLHKFSLKINDTDYSLNEALTAGLIEPMILINRGSQSPNNLLTATLNNGDSSRSYVGTADVNQGWTYTGEQCRATAGIFIIFVLKAGNTFTGLNVAQIASGYYNYVNAYYAPVSTLKFTLATLA